MKNFMESWETNALPLGKNVWKNTFTATDNNIVANKNVGTLEDLFL